MATITKYRGAWSVRWRDADGQHRRKCPDKGTAEELRRDIERAHALGRRWEPQTSRAPTRLGEALTAYQDEIARTSSRHTIKRTGESLEYARQLWGPQLPIGELERGHLSQLWAWLREPANGRHGKQRSLDTVAKHLTTLHSFWTWAAEEYGSECPHPRRIKLPRDPPKLPRAPTWAQCDRMIACCEMEWHRRVAILARFTGARSAELLSLDWSDVELDGKEPRITWRPERTKGGWGGRVVPVPPELGKEMGGWGKRIGRVTRAPAGAAGHLRDDFRRAWKRAGVPEQAWSGQPTHAFRKALETELRAAGVPPEVCNAYIGHTDATTAGRYYADPRWAWSPMVVAVALIPEIAVELDASLPALELIGKSG